MRIEFQDYSMLIKDDISSIKDTHGHKIRFIGPQLEELLNHGVGIPITTRDVKGYFPGVKNPQFDKNLQYLEIGAGMGGFMQYLITQYSPKLKPIVIDPMDPEKIFILIEMGLAKEFSAATKGRLEIIKERCELFLNGEIIHIRERLENVPEKYIRLKGIADCIIENVGPTSHYFQMASNVFVEKEYKKLLHAKNFLQK